MTGLPVFCVNPILRSTFNNFCRFRPFSKFCVQNSIVRRTEQTLVKFRSCPVRTVIALTPLGFHKDGLRHVLYKAPDPDPATTLVKTKTDKVGLLGKLLQLLKSLFEFVKAVLRTLQMCILVSPLVVIAPLAIHSERFQETWFRLLINIIQACGPVYVKLGQWASTRRDIFPLKVCRHLSRLQRHAQTHQWEFTENVLKEAFGNLKVSALLPYVDPNPIGSGCCAQVHVGWIDVTLLSEESRKQLKVRVLDNNRTGKGYGTQIPVAIKVLHPNIAENLDRDLGLLKSMVRFLSFFFPGLQWLSLKESIDEFSNLMESQINLTHEAENLLQFTRDFSHDSNIVFPVPILELCHPKVIVETFESGIPMSTVVNQMDRLSQDARSSIANAGVEMLLKMVFRNNFVHGDLHPGNLMVRGLDHGLFVINKDIPLQLVILDPGIVASLAPKDLQNFKSVFSAVARQDGRRVGELFLEQSHKECKDEDGFIEDMNMIVRDALSDQLSLAKLDVANLLSRVFATLRSHQVKLDPNFTSVVLAIMVLEGLGRSLDPDLDLLLKAAPYLIRI